MIETGVKVADAMTENPIFVEPDASVADCARAMRDKCVGSLIVKEKEELIGIITERDIVVKAVAAGASPKSLRAREVMVGHVITVKPGEDLVEAMRVMRDHDIRHIPVAEGKKLLGLITLKDIVKIEPHLFELLIDKIELREESRKPINRPRPKEGVCNLCGEYCDSLEDMQGQLVCNLCREEETE